MFVIFSEIMSNYGQNEPKYSKFRSNLTNVGLTTNGRSASVCHTGQTTCLSCQTSNRASQNR